MQATFAIEIQERPVELTAQQYEQIKADLLVAAKEFEATHPAHEGSAQLIKLRHYTDEGSSGAYGAVSLDTSEVQAFLDYMAAEYESAFAGAFERHSPTAPPAWIGEDSTSTNGGRIMEQHGIGWAVKQLQAGLSVTRLGWNGKPQFLRLQKEPPARQPEFMTLPFVYITTVQGDRVPWLCSQTDLLATDWDLYQG